MAEIFFDKGTYKQCKNCGKKTWISKSVDYCFECQLGGSPSVNNTHEEIQKAIKKEINFRKLHGFD